MSALPSPAISRRAMLASTAGLAGAAVIAAASRPLWAAGETRLRMYRGASCGCCLKWAAAAQAQGLAVDVVNVADVMAVKARLGVPDALVSCHTTVAGPYWIEGHVPFDAVRRLLKERPAVRGIAVPGMPAGSPGMEMPDGRRDPFEVLALDSNGRTRRFA